MLGEQRVFFHQLKNYAMISDQLRIMFNLDTTGLYAGGTNHLQSKLVKHEQPKVHNGPTSKMCFLSCNILAFSLILLANCLVTRYLFIWFTLKNMLLICK